MHHDYEVIKYCVEAYMRYIHSLASALIDIESEIKEHESALDLLGVDYSSGRVSTTTTPDALAEGVIKLLDLREKLIEEHARCAQDLSEAREICRYDESRRALWMSRVESLSYAQVARYMGYSERTIKRMIERGRIQVYYVMPEVWRRYPIPNAMPK